jgi:hypothetical protein
MVITTHYFYAAAGASKLKRAGWAFQNNFPF